MATRRIYVDVDLNGNKLTAGSLVLNGSNVSPVPGFLNKLIGGNFDTNPWQRGSPVSTTASNYTADRWLLNSSSSKTLTVTKTIDTPTVAQCGFLTQNCLQASYPGTAYTPLASGDMFGLAYNIEGWDYGYLAQQPITISFWVKSSKTGIYSLALRNAGTDRACVSEFTINTANTWEYKAITFPASPSAGTWLYGGGIGLRLFWALGAGSTYRTATLDSWQTGNYVASSNQVNWLDTQNATFRIALPQCEVGAYASPFEHRSYAQELALCYRYYARLYVSLRFPSTMASQFVSSVINLPAAMRASPTTTLITAGTRANVSTMTVGAVSGTPGGVRAELTSSLMGDTYALNDIWELNAEL